MDPRFATKRQKILVVEDYRDGAIAWRLLLEMLGYHVRVAYSGTDAVKVAGEWFPDIVLCDVRLPGVDGYGVAQALRGNPATAQACLIAMSACADEWQALAAGFDYFFTKPADPLALIRTMSEGRQPLTARDGSGWTVPALEPSQG
jgi:CheY-like chemotaxis protein